MVNNRIRFLLFIALCFLAVSSSFAQDLGDMEDVAEKVLNLFESPLVKTVLSIALGGLAIGLIMNKDNESMKKRFVIWLIAVGLLRGMTEVVGLFFGA